MYSVEQVRDKRWVQQNSHTPTLMDYSRFNYVAQPEDGLEPADLIPKVGPYDTWATMWGYKPIQGARTPDEERPTLDAWAREQDKTPWYRFSTAQAGGSDPFNQTEAVGDADAIQATTLGLKNLQRVADMLLSATTTQPGEPYEELTEVYGRLVGQWTLEMNHVSSLVGGVLSQQRHVGQDGLRFTPVPRARPRFGPRKRGGVLLAAREDVVVEAGLERLAGRERLVPPEQHALQERERDRERDDRDGEEEREPRP